jgi:hypothetical protein
MAGHFVLQCFRLCHGFNLAPLARLASVLPLKLCPSSFVFVLFLRQGLTSAFAWAWLQTHDPSVCASQVAGIIGMSQ